MIYEILNLSQVPIRVASKDPTTASKAGSFSRSRPRVRVGCASVSALVKLSRVWVVQVGHLFITWDEKVILKKKNVPCLAF